MSFLEIKPGYETIQEAIKGSVEEAVYQTLQTLDGVGNLPGWQVIPKDGTDSISGNLADIFSERFIQINN